MYLNTVVEKKDDLFKDLVSFITEQVLTPSQVQKTFKHFRGAWKMDKNPQNNHSSTLTEKDLLDLALHQQNKLENGYKRMTRSISKNYSIQMENSEESPEMMKNKLQEGLIENFVTKKEELELFKQNDQKQYDENSEDI